jgi:DNA-binding transcriptional regulator YiaG
MTNQADSIVRLARLYNNLQTGRSKRIRQAAQLTQADVARAVGASRCAVASWEDGRKRPKGDQATRYRTLLDSLAGLLGESFTEVET